MRTIRKSMAITATQFGKDSNKVRDSIKRASVSFKLEGGTEAGDLVIENERLKSTLMILNQKLKVGQDTDGIVDKLTKENSTLRKEHELAISKMRRQYEEQDCDLRKENSDAIGKLNSTNAEAIGKLNSDHAEAIGKLNYHNAEAIDKLNTDNAQAIGKLNSNHAEAIGKFIFFD